MTIQYHLITSLLALAIIVHLILYKWVWLPWYKLFYLFISDLEGLATRTFRNPHSESHGTVTCYLKSEVEQRYNILIVLLCSNAIYTA